MAEGAGAVPWPGRGGHYRDTGSPVHRLGAGPKLVVAVSIPILALAWPHPAWLAALCLLVVGGYRAARLTGFELWQDARWLVAQTILIAALAALGGGHAGIAVGLRAGVQIALCLLPGLLLLRTTPSGRLLDGAKRLLPGRWAFALTASLRFVPYFAREIHEIVTAQRLRGARLELRRAWDPRCWRDWLECVAVPVAVRAIHTAQEAAWAAEMRGLGDTNTRPARDLSAVTTRGEGR
ncbi:MAG: energy-coupling factor transporter transmembrane component T family protein [Myxococcota bacterium]